MQSLDLQWPRPSAQARQKASAFAKQNSGPNHIYWPGIIQAPRTERSAPMYVNRHGCTHTHTLSLTHTHTHAYESEHRARHVSRTRACVTAHLCLRSTRTHVPTRAVLIFMRGVCVCHSMCVLSSTCAKTGREGERERGGGGVSFTRTRFPSGVWLYFSSVVAPPHDALLVLHCIHAYYENTRPRQRRQTYQQLKITNTFAPRNALLHGEHVHIIMTTSSGRQT